MGDIRLITPAFLFLTYYISVMLTCGLLTWKLRHLVQYQGVGVLNSASIDTRLRNALASFLIGTGFAPFVIGLIQGLFLFFVPGLPQSAYVVAHVALLSVTLICFRNDLKIFFTNVFGYLRPRRWPAVLLLVLIISVVIRYALPTALRPIKAHDATVYALDARRLTEKRSLSGLMTWTPDEENHLANHNHGSSYQLYLSTALLFGPEPRQDFSLRVAQQLCNIHVFLCLAGLGLSVSGTVGLLSPILLLFSLTYEYAFYHASRDPYRILPLLIIFGLIGNRFSIRSREAIHGLLLFCAFVFLWNSHAASLAIAPTMLVCIAVFSRGWRSKAVVTAAFALATCIGGSSLLKTFVRTGDPTRDSFVIYRQYEGTPLLRAYLNTRQALTPGVKGATAKLQKQFQKDGAILVSVLWISLVVVPVLMAVQSMKRGQLEPMPVVVMVTWLFVLLFESQVVGLFDWIDHRISPFLIMNSRYRLPVYPLVAFLGSWIIAQVIGLLETPRAHYLAVPIILVLFLLGSRSVNRHWRLCCANIPVLIDSKKGDGILGEKLRSWWWMETFKMISKDETILMERAYRAWYNTDNRVMAMHDPRLRSAYLAKQPEQAVALLDNLKIRFVCLTQRRLNLIAASAFGQALKSKAYEIFDTQGEWRIFRRSDSNL